MYLAIESRSVWDHTSCFPPALLEELKFWFNNIESFSVYSIRPPRDSSTVFFFFPMRATQPSEGFPPSSMDLWPAVVDRRFGSKFYFSRGEALYRVLLSLVEHLKPKKVKTFTHNLSAARIVSVGSFQVHLQSVAMSIFCLCFSHGIALEAQWIPRSLDGRADLLSRFVDKYAWQVNPLSPVVRKQINLIQD